MAQMALLEFIKQDFFLALWVIGFELIQVVLAPNSTTKNKGIKVLPGQSFNHLFFSL